VPLLRSPTTTVAASTVLNEEKKMGSSTKGPQERETRESETQES